MVPGDVLEREVMYLIALSDIQMSCNGLAFDPN